MFLSVNMVVSPSSEEAEAGVFRFGVPVSKNKEPRAGDAALWYLSTSVQGPGSNPQHRKKKEKKCFSLLLICTKN
jgi:hypothetical protein